MKVPLFVVVIALIAIALPGCGSRVEKRTLLIADDNSGSVSTNTRSYYRGLSEGIVSRQKGEAYLRLYIFAQTPRLVYEGRPRTADQIWSVNDQEVVGGGTASKSGTLYGPILQQFIQDCQAKPGQPAYGVLFSDGGCDDAEETRAAAKQLAACPNFRCLFVGPVIVSDAQGDNNLRLRLERILSSLKDNGKLLVSGPHDIDYGVKQFAQKSRQN